MCLPGLVNSDGEEAAESIPHTHTGGEIPRAADAGASGVAVVAVLFVVEGQFHEAGEGERALRFDQGTQHVVQ